MHPELHSPCPICKSPYSSVIYPALRKGIKSSYSPSESVKEQGAIVRCMGCNVIYKDPFPSAATLQNGYEESIDEQYLSLLPERRATFAHVLSGIEKYWKLLHGEKSIRKQKPRILDVGCAEGTLLFLAREHGWNVAGVEPNKHFVKWASKQYKLKIFQGSVFDSVLKKNSYDVITLLDVIEHVPDPVQFLRRCYELLAPGGIIFISTPDIGSPIAKLMRRRWFYILSIHVFYFTRQTLSTILRTAGFTHVETRPYLLRTRLSYVADKSRNYLGPLGSLFQTAVRILGLESREITYWLGQRMFVARKPIR